MHAHHLEFKIDQLKKDKMILALESIAIFILALFVTVFLPQLLFQFYYAGQDLTAEPQLVKYIPAASFVVAILYFVYATVLMVGKKMKIMQLEKELSMMPMDGDCNCDCGACQDHEDHHSWMTDDDEEEMSMKKDSKKKTTKKKA